MLKQRFLLTGFFVVLLVGASLVFLAQPEDPIAKFRNPDGSISIPGGQFTKEVQRLLSLPAPSPVFRYSVWIPEDSAYPTMTLTNYEFMSPNLNVYQRTEQMQRRPSDLFRPVLDGFHAFFSFDWLFGTASAVNRFAVFGDAQCAGTPNPTNLATDLDCWSTTSGGNGDGLPVSGDNLVLNASTGSGTGTMDVSLNIGAGTINTTGFTGIWALATFTVTTTGALTHAGSAITASTGGLDTGVATMGATITATGAAAFRFNSLTIGSGGSLNGSSSTITMDGDWNSSAGSFVYNTSTVVFAATATITTPSVLDTDRFYNLQVSASVTATMASHFRVTNVITLGASATLSTGTATLTSGPSGANPIVCGASAAFTGTGILKTGYTSGGYNLPVCTYPNLQVGGGVTVTVTGTLTVSLSLNVAGAGSSGTILTVGTNSVSVGTTLTLQAAGNFGAISFTSGSITVTGDTTINAGAYIQWGSSTGHVFVGTWTNSTTSSSWDAGTGTVTFRSATASKTMTFAGANLAEDEFSSINFDTTAGVATNYTMATRGLRWGGTLTINSTNANVHLNTSVSNFSLTGGSITLLGSFLFHSIEVNGSTVSVANVTLTSTGTNRAFLNLGSSTWTVSGTWLNGHSEHPTIHDWSAGTSTVTFTSTSSPTMTFNRALTVPEFYNVGFSPASTSTFTVAASATGSNTDILTASGTVTVGASAILAMGTLDTSFDRLDVNGTMTMNGQSVDNIDIDTNTGTVSVSQWSQYNITAGGVPTVRWTMNPSAANANIVVALESVTAHTTFSVYRDGIELQQAGSDGSGVVTFSGGSLTAGWSPHEMIIGAPGLSFSSGGGGTPDDLAWTWRHLSEDLTVEFVVPLLGAPAGTYNYDWLVNGAVVGSGERFQYTFSISGSYMVVLRATVVDYSLESSQSVTAQSISFLGRYFPVLALVFIALWFIILLVADALKTDAGRLVAMVILAVGLLVAFVMATLPFKTFTFTGAEAWKTYIGVGLVCSAGAARRKFFGIVLFAAGLVLLLMVYTMILG